MQSGTYIAGRVKTPLVFRAFRFAEIMSLPERPKGLPNFDAPPLNEVVLGVQFAPPVGYKQIHAGEVWSIFKSDYPRVEEAAPLQPQFETFGLPQPAQLRFNLSPGGRHNRFWFLTESGDELLQFQNDRLLHNWRKVGNEANPYPHFESMIVKFERELRRLEQYVSTLHAQSLNCNQAEITYINHITPNDAGSVSDWFKTVNVSGEPVEDIALSYRRIIKDAEGSSYGRLYSELNPAVKKDGHRTLSLNLTVRGAPAPPNIDASLDFIKRGRELIVKEFAAITTESAHERWKRIK